MNDPIQSKSDIRRLEIAGLYTLGFFGYVLHMVIHNTMAHGMDADMLREMTAMMEKPAILTMFFVWNIFTILPAFLSLLLKGRRGWWFIAVFGLLVLLANAWHCIAHMMQGDIFNGGNTLVMQIIPSAWAVALSFAYAKSFNSAE
jgi:hypothetical protein